jgi:hypothetical protein
MDLQGKRLRFLHPPRTGGSSITVAWEINKNSSEYWGHRVPHCPKPEEEWWYGFTRNPWDRVVSLYHLANPYGKAKQSSFSQWVLAGMDGTHQFGKRFAEQIALPTIRWLAEADWIGRFENRATDLALLSELLDRPFPSEHIAATPVRLGNYMEYYNAEAALYVAERYAEDIEVFGYEFS